MSLNEYIDNIKNVIKRLHIMFPTIVDNDNEMEIKSILKQLQFILYYAETGSSFKKGIIKKNKEVYHELFEFYPADDGELKDAITTIYSDLMLNEFNIGHLTQKESAVFFDIIHDRKAYYQNIAYPQAVAKQILNNYMISDIFFNKLYWAHYTKLWIRHGLKKLQYFFLINLFNFDVQALRAVKDMMHPDAENLCRDIIKIQNFYKSRDAEGTCMDLYPVEMQEINGNVCLVDLNGRIIAP